MTTRNLVGSSQTDILNSINDTLKGQTLTVNITGATTINGYDDTIQLLEDRLTTIETYQSNYSNNIVFLDVINTVDEDIKLLTDTVADKKLWINNGINAQMDVYDEITNLKSDKQDNVDSTTDLITNTLNTNTITVDSLQSKTGDDIRLISDSNLIIQGRDTDPTTNGYIEINCNDAYNHMLNFVSDNTGCEVVFNTPNANSQAFIFRSLSGDNLSIRREGGITSYLPLLMTNNDITGVNQIEAVDIILNGASLNTNLTDKQALINQNILDIQSLNTEQQTQDDSITDLNTRLTTVENGSISKSSLNLDNGTETASLTKEALGDFVIQNTGGYTIIQQGTTNNMTLTSQETRFNNRIEVRGNIKYTGSLYRMSDWSNNLQAYQTQTDILSEIDTALINKLSVVGDALNVNTYAVANGWHLKLPIYDTQFTDLETMISNNISLTNTNSNSISSLQTQQNTNSGLISSLQTQQGTNINDILNLQTATTNNTTSINSNLSSINGLTTLTNGHSTDISGLQTTTNGHSTDISGLQTTTNGLTTLTNGHITDISTLQTTTNGHSTDISGLTTLTSGHSIDISGLTTDISGLTTLTNTHSTDISGLQTTTNGHSTDISTLQTLTNTHSTDISTLQTLTNTHSTDISGLQTTTNGLTTLTNGHSTDISGLTTLTSTHSTDISGLTTLTNGHSIDISGLQTTTSGLTTLTNGHSIDISALQTTTNGLTTDISGLTTLTNTNSTDISNLESQISTLQSGGNVIDNLQVNTISPKDTTKITIQSDMDFNTVNNIVNCPTITAIENDISSLQTTTSSNTSSINTNTANITSNANSINANTTAINNNSSSISSLQTTTSSNTSLINQNSTDISALQTTTSSNTSSINTNTANITSNANSINSNITAINNNSSSISSLQTTTSSNTSLINTNTANITSNTSSINSIDTQINQHLDLDGSVRNTDGAVLSIHHGGNQSGIRWYNADATSQMDMCFGVREGYSNHVNDAGLILINTMNNHKVYLMINRDYDKNVSVAGSLQYWNIDFSAPNVSMTMSHLCVIKTSELGGIRPGMIVSATNDICNWATGRKYSIKDSMTPDDAVNVVEISKTRRDKKVYGVYSYTIPVNSEGVSTCQTELGFYEFDDVLNEDETRIKVNASGEGCILVMNTNGNLEIGDYIQTSIYSGYGEKQTDDIKHSYTVAKITMDCDFNIGNDMYQCDFMNGSGYKWALLPCVYEI